MAKNGTLAKSQELQPSFQTTPEQITIGIDLGDRFSHCCVLGPDGKVLTEGRLRSTPETMARHFQDLPPSRIAIEVGTHSRWVSQLLEQWGHEVIVANPRNLRMIADSIRKSDQVDAHMLARLARVDPKLLSPIVHRKQESYPDIIQLKARDLLVKNRTRLISHLNKEIYLLDKAIESTAQNRSPETNRLRQISGVGLITALQYVLTIGDPGRFAHSRDVPAYLGLTPRRHQSGSVEQQLRISKAGNKQLRSLLVQCAQYLLGRFGPDSDLKRWGTRMFERGGKNSKKRAIVAVARKLAVLLHRLWVTGDTYHPLYNASLAALAS